MTTPDLIKPDGSVWSARYITSRRGNVSVIYAPSVHVTIALEIGERVRKSEAPGLGFGRPAGGLSARRPLTSDRQILGGVGVRGGRIGIPPKLGIMYGARWDSLESIQDLQLPRKEVS